MAAMRSNRCLDPAAPARAPSPSAPAQPPPFHPARVPSLCPSDNPRPFPVPPRRSRAFPLDGRFFPRRPLAVRLCPTSLIPLRHPRFRKQARA